MRFRSTTLLLCAASLGVLLSNCSNQSAQVSEVQLYLGQVRPVTQALGRASASFSASVGTDTTPGTMERLKTTLEGTLADLDAISVNNPDVRKAHDYLMRANRNYIEAIGLVDAALKNPQDSSISVLKNDVQLHIDRATSDILAWRQIIASTLSPDERAEFLHVPPSKR